MNNCNFASLRIAGKFVDSYLYKQRLVLFESNGDVRIIHWNSLIQELSYYRRDFDFRFLDSRMQVNQACDVLIDEEIEFSLIEKHTEKKFLASFPIYNSNIRIYKDAMYVAAKEGLFSVSLDMGERFGVDVVNQRKFNDMPSFDLDVHLDVVAVAAGREGAYRSRVYGNFSRDSNQSMVSRVPSNKCRYARGRLISSMNQVNPIFVGFKRAQLDGDASSEEKMENEFSSKSFTIKEDRFSRGHVFSDNDVVALVEKSKIKIFKYHLKDLIIADEFDILPQKGDFVTGAIGKFGLCVEFDKKLSVIDDFSEPINFDSPSSWRIFDKSVQYKNQLHANYKDGIRVLSFNRWAKSSLTKSKGLFGLEDDGNA